MRQAYDTELLRGFVNGKPTPKGCSAMLPPHSERPRRCCNLVWRLKPCLLRTPLKCKVAGMWYFHVYCPIESGFLQQQHVAVCRTCLISILSYPSPSAEPELHTARIVAQSTGFGVLRSGKFGETVQSFKHPRWLR